MGNAPIAKEYQLGVITYSSLASGFLSGKYRSENDFSRSLRGHGMKKYLDKKGFAILQALDILSKKYDTAYSTIALAWLIQHPNVTAPIASATKSSQLKELMAAVELQLSQEDLALLNEAGK